MNLKAKAKKTQVIFSATTPRKGYFQTHPHSFLPNTQGLAMPHAYD